MFLSLKYLYCYTGFVLEGFHNLGLKTEDFNLSEIQDILTQTLVSTNIYYGERKRERELWDRGSYIERQVGNREREDVR
jgi:hypothetical protein